MRGLVSKRMRALSAAYRCFERVCAVLSAPRPVLPTHTSANRRYAPRTCTLVVGLAGAAVLGFAVRVHAAPNVAVEPAFTFSSAWTPGWYTSVGAAWTQVQSGFNQCSTSAIGTTCGQALNLHREDSYPISIVQDGVPYILFFDEYSCTTYTPEYGGNTVCGTSSDVGTIISKYHCPDPLTPNISDVPGTSQPTIENIACVTTQIDPLPAPLCYSCLDKSFYPGTGQSLQVELDFEGGSGLSFSRTYRSNNGFFASSASAFFADNTQPTGTASARCYSSHYSMGQGQEVPYCFPYISAPLSVSYAYQLATEDGRFIPFMGSSNAVTQNADINERVTQVTTSGGNQWQVTRENDSQELYGADGSLLQRTLRGGAVITFTYSSPDSPSSAPGPGYLVSESDPFGHTLSFAYSGAGQMTQMTDPAGGIYQYAYDSNNNLTSVTYPDGTSRTYLYNELDYTEGTNLPNALTGIIDENGIRFATFSYNSQGQALGTQHAGADNYSMNYVGNPTFVTDPLGTLRAYAFQNVLSYVRDTVQYQLTASGGYWATQIENLDANGNTSTLTDFNGNVTTYAYDLTRNLETSRTEASGTPAARTINTQWHPSFRLPVLITEPTRTTSFSYDANGNLLNRTVTDTTVTPNVPRNWTYSYDSYGRMLTATGPRTDVNSTTTYTYYTCTTGGQCGELQSVTDPVGNVTTFNAYNPYGQPLTITDPNGVVTTMTYDARERLTSRTVGGERTSFSYYPTGLLEQVTLPDGSSLAYTYDGAHRLTQISDGLGNSVLYTLDAMGNRTSEATYDPSGALHRTHSRIINALNRLYQDVNAAGTPAVTTTYGYDNNGNQTQVNAPLARNTTNTFDALNRLVQISDPAGGTTSFTYDAANDLTSVTDPLGLITSYAYDGFGDLVAKLSPDTASTMNTYDSGGNLATSTDARGAVASYTYDPLNRVTSITYQYGGVADQTLVFGYDAGPNGARRLTSAADANHSLAWNYDGLGRVIGKGLTVGPVNLSVGYAYANGDLVGIVTPSGQAVVYGYDGNHQIASIAVNSTVVLSGVTYEPFGAVNGWNWGNGTSTSRSFNTDGLVGQIVTAGVTLGYTYDNANRISSITDSSDGTLSWSYGYDALDRLMSATSTNITDGWTYDGNGNVLSQTGSTPITFAISPGSNQLGATTGNIIRNYSYDASGNTIAYGTTAFSYNNRGRMMATSASATDYLYNALGQMIEKSGALGTTIFMYDESEHLIGEYDGGGNLIEETVWLGDIPVATLEANGSGGVNISYVHTDHLNSPRKIARSSDNQLVWRWDADPFGTAMPNQNPVGLGVFSYNLRFPGQYYMAETGLNQNWNRDYDPLTGKYLESDPIGLSGGVDTYAYVASDPVNNVDPSGLILLAPTFLSGTVNGIFHKNCPACQHPVTDWRISRSQIEWRHLFSPSRLSVPMRAGR